MPSPESPKRKSSVECVNPVLKKALLNQTSSVLRLSPKISIFDKRPTESKMPPYTMGTRQIDNPLLLWGNNERKGEAYRSGSGDRAFVRGKSLDEMLSNAMDERDKLVLYCGSLDSDLRKTISLVRARLADCNAIRDRNIKLCWAIDEQGGDVLEMTIQEHKASLQILLEEVEYKKKKENLKGRLEQVQKYGVEGVSVVDRMLRRSKMVRQLEREIEELEEKRTKEWHQHNQKRLLSDARWNGSNDWLDEPGTDRLYDEQEYGDPQEQGLPDPFEGDRLTDEQLAELLSEPTEAMIKFEELCLYCTRNECKGCDGYENEEGQAKHSS